MESQYFRMRKKAGIEEILDNSDGSDYETEQVFKKLRPNSNYKLMDILTGKVKDPKRRQRSCVSGINYKKTQKDKKNPNLGGRFRNSEAEINLDNS